MISEFEVLCGRARAWAESYGGTAAMAGLPLALALGAPGAAHAAPPSAGETTGTGTWQVVPYFYGMSVKGEMGLAGTSVDVDVGPEDIVGGIKAAAMGYLSWTDGEQFVYAETLGASWSDDSFDQFYDQAVDSTLAFLELGYGRTYDFEVRYPAPGTLLLSPYIGVRYAEISVEAQAGNQTLSADDSWLDPVVGIIAEAPLWGPVNYGLKLDGAGFGIDKDRYWSATGALRYYPSLHWNIVIGYRVARFEAKPIGSNQIDWDLRGSGPEAGIGYTF